MADAANSETLELIVMNAALGVACVVLLGVTLWGVLAELLARRRRPRGDAAPSASPERPRHRTALSEMKDQLPDCWPPTAEELRAELAASRR